MQVSSGKTAAKPQRKRELERMETERTEETETAPNTSRHEIPGK